MLLPKLRRALHQACDPNRAPAMQAYMKSAMPYHGVPTPLLRKVCKSVFADVQFASAARWQAQVLEIWRNARFREERYAALSLAGDKRAQPFQTLSAIKMYEELIVTGAWWDYVDDIASHRIGPILRDIPRQCGARCSPGASRTICGSGARRFCASSASRRKLTCSCSMHASSPHLDLRNFFCGRQLAGRCASTLGLILPR